MKVREVWVALPLASSGLLFSGRGALGGFLCTTAGTLQITAGQSGPDVVAVFDVAEGTWYPLPFDMPTGAYAVLGSSAAGTFGIGSL